jgi:hypothetical protein
MPEVGGLIFYRACQAHAVASGVTIDVFAVGLRFRRRKNQNEGQG